MYYSVMTIVNFTEELGWGLNLGMRSVPRAVATGSPLIARIENSRIVTRSLLLSVLTPQQSFCKLRPHLCGRGQRISQHLPLLKGEGWVKGLARIGNYGLFLFSGIRAV